ncbi:hypothetical protein ABEB36_002759 [Hypothenemus hampei]|uniref:Uncharacterized protein n=1 Tax=Hypothenemus hampei TaxID=57062 RepID=A0ABD1F6W9_HYPHA
MKVAPWPVEHTQQQRSNLEFQRADRIKKVLVCFGNSALESRISYRRNLEPAIVELQKDIEEDGTSVSYKRWINFAPPGGIRDATWNCANAAHNIIVVATDCVDYKNNTKSSCQMVGETNWRSALIVIDRISPVGFLVDYINLMIMDIENCNKKRYIYTGILNQLSSRSMEKQYSISHYRLITKKS